MAKMKWYDWITLWIVLIGGINWGLAVFDVNLVTAIFGTTVWSKVIYGLVGLSTIVTLVRTVYLAMK